MKNLLSKFTTYALALGLTLAPRITHAVAIEQVFQKYRINGYSEYNELNNTANLPDPDIVDLIIQIIYLILRITSVLTFLAITVAGIMFIVSRGEGDSNLLEQAKKTLTYSVIGVIIIMVSYAIVYGVTAIRYNF